MQIVIDIDEDLYDHIKNSYILCSGMRTGKSFIAVIFNAILNGTPLPKGHGRLVDVGKCDRKLFYQQCGGSDSLITVKSAFNMLMSLPTVIDEDKESE